MLRRVLMYSGSVIRWQHAATILLSAMMVMVAYPLPLYAENRVALSIGAEYRSGDYGIGGDNIEDVYVPVSIDVESERLVFRATVPYARVRGPEGSLVASGTAIPGQGATVSNGGMGDVTASLTLRDLYHANGMAVDLTGSVKLGTADENDGLGTGETDYAGQVDVYRFLDGGILFGTAGYKVRGDPSPFDLKDTWFASLGGARYLPGQSNIGLALSYAPKLVSGGDNLSELTVFMGRRLNDRMQLRGHILTGLADGSPDWGAGIYLKYWL